MAGLALALAESAMARDIAITSESQWSGIIPAPTASDTITISAGGILRVDINATVGKLTIGNDTTEGALLFDSTPRLLTVTGDVLFGASAGNRLDMSGSGAAHELRVAGRFLPAGGAGVFTASLGTVVYNANGAQTVAAKNYKNLTLTGSGAKTLENGVAVQAKLLITGTATVAGSVNVTYGGLASLEYAGTAEQTTTGLEWPTPIGVPVLINNSFGVKLNENKTIASTLTISAGSTIKLNGKDLTSTGNIVHGGSPLAEPGRVILAGSSAQTLIGTGHYGNLILNNSAGATADAVGLFVDGRLTITLGRMTLQTGSAGLVGLLTLGTTDQPASSPGPTAPAPAARPIAVTPTGPGPAS